MNDELNAIVFHSSFIIHRSSLPSEVSPKMFCPQCGQQQANEVRFCSRCGFPLAGVNELLLRGGQLPVLAGPGAGASAPGESPQRTGVRQGVATTVSAMLLIPS